MKQLFLIIGAPGSGKTTDCELIAAQAERITHYSVGDMLRAEAAGGSVRGLEIRAIIEQGDIVPSEIGIAVIIDAIKNAPTPVVIIDGYPRSVAQMEALEHYLSSEGQVSLCGVVEVVVSEAVARERVLGRARGVDDDANVFTRRMRVYAEPLADIEAFYTQKNLLKKIDGARAVETVVADLRHHIDSQL